MIEAPRPALAALTAGVRHVGRHHRALPIAAPATLDRRLALRVALNVVRELDTLLGHAVTETAAMAGVVLAPRGEQPAGVALAELRRVLDPRAGACRELGRADRLRHGLTRAVASRGALARYRVDAIYPLAIAATYRRIAGELSRLAGEPEPMVALPSPVARVAGDDVVTLHG